MEPLVYERDGRLIGIVVPTVMAGEIVLLAWGWCLPCFRPLLPGPMLLAAARRR